MPKTSQSQKEKPKVKRAKNAYMFFSGKNFPSVMEQNPNYAPHEIAAHLGNHWRNNMSEEKKEKYYALAAKDKQRASSERIRLFPKRAPTAYTEWTSTNRKAIQAKHPELSFGEISARLSVLWKKEKARASK